MPSSGAATQNVFKNSPTHLRQRTCRPAAKWLAYFTPFFSEAERKNHGCQHRLFFSQVEYCDNLVFHKRAALDAMGEWRWCLRSALNAEPTMAISWSSAEGSSLIETWAVAGSDRVVQSSIHRRESVGYAVESISPDSAAPAPHRRQRLSTSLGLAPPWIAHCAPHACEAVAYRECHLRPGLMMDFQRDLVIENPLPIGRLHDASLVKPGARQRVSLKIKEAVGRFLRGQHFHRKSASLKLPFAQRILVLDLDRNR